MEVVLGSIWIVVISSQVSKTHDLVAFCYTILQLQSFGWTPFVIDAKVESTKYMGQNEVLFGTCWGAHWELAKHVATNILGVKYCQNENKIK